MSECELNVITGEVMQEATDIDLPSPIPIQFTRFYISSSKYKGPIGYGWVHNYEISLEISDQEIHLYNGIEGETVYKRSELDGIKGPLIGKIEDNIILTFPEKTKKSFCFDGNRWVLREDIDQDGNRLLFDYRSGLLAGIQDTEGRQLILKYNNSRMLTEIDLAHHSFEKPKILVRYEFDTSQNLITATDATGIPFIYEYEDHLLVRFIDRAGKSRYYAYDSHRRCIFGWSDGDRLIRRRQYDDIHKAVLLTDSLGSEVLFRHNDAGLVTEFVDALGQTTQYIFGQNSKLIAEIGSDGIVSAMGDYNPETHTLVEVDGSGGRTETVLNEVGQMVRTTTPLGHTREHQYDERGNVIGITIPNGATWRFTYDVRGVVESAIDPFGYEIRHVLTNDGLTVKLIDQFGTILEQTFDSFGNLIAHIDAAGFKTSYTYWVQDEPETETLPDGGISRYRYDGNCNLIEEIDPIGRISRYGYDGSENLIVEIDPSGGQVKWVFDQEDNLVRVINQKGEILECKYDILYNQIEVRYFDGRTERFEYDSLGRRTAIISGNGKRTEFVYYQEEDSIQRRLFASGKMEEYEFDAEGQVSIIRSTPPTGSLESPSTAEFTYDDNGNLTREVHDGLQIDYEYDLCNRLVAIRDSLGGETIFVRGERYNIERIIDDGGEYQLSYLPTTEVTQIIFPNGMRQKFSYDVCGRLIKRTVESANGNELAWRRFAYDAADQLVEMDDWHWGSFRYFYDARGRLIRVSQPDGTLLETYSYDDNNNIIRCPLVNNVTVGLGNRVIRADNKEYGYDGSGNLITQSDGTNEWRFEYDDDGQLVKVLRNMEEIARYEYDLLNRRTRKWTPSGSVRFLYQTYSLRAEVYEDGQQAHYLSLPDNPVPLSQRWDGKCYFYSYDQVGRPTEVWNEAGELVLAIHSDAYGARIQEYRPAGDKVIFPFNFMGQYRDMETGFYYNHFRYYDATLGRYISQDPFGILFGLDVYIYPTNPLNWTDPIGLMPTFTCMPKWDACQQWYAREKIAALNNEMKDRKITRRCTKCRANAQRRDFKGKCGGKKIARGRAIDHFVELQTSGYDRCCGNLVAVPKKFNSELGRQFRSMMKGIKVGQVIGKVSPSGCDTKGKCGKTDRKKMMQRPPIQTCPKKEQKPLNCK